MPYEQRTRRSRDRVLGGHVLPLTVMLTSVRAHLPARRHLAIYSSKLPGHSSHLPCRPSRWVWSALKLSFAAFPSSPAARADLPKPSKTRFLVSSFPTATSSRCIARSHNGTAFPSHLLDPEVVARTTQSFSNVTSPIFPRTCTMSLTGHCRARQCRVEFSMALVDLHQQHWKKCERSENILRGYFGTFYATSGKDGRSGEI